MMNPDEAHKALTEKFADLKTTYPTVTFGYVGNCGVERSGAFDDRSWYVFLPHFGRVGDYRDRVGGYRTHDLGKMLADWDKIVKAVGLGMANRTAVDLTPRMERSF